MKTLLIMSLFVLSFLFTYAQDINRTQSEIQIKYGTPSHIDNSNGGKFLIYQFNGMNIVFTLNNLNRVSVIGMKFAMEKDFDEYAAPILQNSKYNSYKNWWVGNNGLTYTLNKIKKTITIQ